MSAAVFFAIFEYSTILEKSFQITVTTALGVQESLRHVYIETLYGVHVALSLEGLPLTQKQCSR